MDQPVQRHLPPRTLVLALAATAIALLVLAVADTVTPYGWKVFVLAKIFKIGWAASVAFVVGLSVVKLLPQTLGGVRSDARAANLGAFVTAFAAFAAALITLGSLMPDWSPWSEVIAGMFLAGWAVIAVVIRAASR